MKNKFFISMNAEIKKHHKCQYHSIAIYFSMILWPILEVITSYYTYKPFLELNHISPISRWISEDKVFIFIISGYVVYLFFSSLIQSAWGFSMERINGTLELIYLSPTNRFSIILGNALSSLLTSTWMFSILCIGSTVIFSDIEVSSIFMIIISIVVLVIPSVCWGMFLNTIFLLTRDVRLLYSIILSPMEVFTGVKVPFKIFPLWAKLIGTIFPLTWSLNIIRKIYIDSANLFDIKNELIIILIICIILVNLSIFLMKKAEVYSKRTGSNVLF